MIIAMILYQYVNVFQQPALALSFGFLALFLVAWSLSYFAFVLCYHIFSRRPLAQQYEKSYSLGLLTGMYVMLNSAMMVMNNWNILLGIIFAVVFMLFILVIAYGSSQ